MAPTRADLLLNTLETIQETQQTLLYRQDAHHTALLKRIDDFELDYGKRLRFLERDNSVVRAIGVAFGFIASAIAYNWQSIKAWLNS